MKTRLIIILLPVLFLAACGSGGSSIGRNVFEGYLVSGFEVASFVPCSEAGEAGYGQGYWVTPAENIDIFGRYQELVDEAGHNPVTGYLPVYVRFEGKLSPEGSYGHLGAYKHEVTVTRLLEISLDGKCAE